MMGFQATSIYVVIFSIMGGLSILGSIFLMVLYFWKKELRNGSFKRVFWMSFCDLGLSLKFWLAIVTQAPVSMARNKFVCLLSAISGNFFAIATISWYFIISVCVFSVFQSQKSKWRLILTRESFQHIYVWSLSLFGAFLPWWAGDYGDMDDGTQCWISGVQDPMKLTLMLPLFLYLIFAFFLLIYVFFMSDSNFTLSKRLKERMLAFVGVFTVAWIWPALAALWDFMSPGTLPVTLHYMDVGAISGSGFFNFLVWVTSPAFRSAICPTMSLQDDGGGENNDDDVSLQGVIADHYDDDDRHHHRDDYMESLLADDTGDSLMKPMSTTQETPWLDNRIDHETAYRADTTNDYSREPSGRLDQSSRLEQSSSVDVFPRNHSAN